MVLVLRSRYWLRLQVVLHFFFGRRFELPT